MFQESARAFLGQFQRNSNVDYAREPRGNSIGDPLESPPENILGNSMTIPRSNVLQSRKIPGKCLGNFLGNGFWNPVLNTLTFIASQNNHITEKVPMRSQNFPSFFSLSATTQYHGNLYTYTHIYRERERERKRERETKKEIYLYI